MKKLLSGLLLSGICTLSFAEVPVVDYSTAVGQESAKSFPAPSSDEFSPSVTTRADLSSEQRINRLEYQVRNINEQRLIGKIEELQQNIQRLNGQVESQSHQIEQLNSQVKEFYQDLDQRVGGAKKDHVKAPNIMPVFTAKDSAIEDSTIVPATADNMAGVFADNKAEKNDSQLSDSGAGGAFLKEKQMYQTAIDLLPDKKHESGNSLREYLTKYPRGLYAANAHYWLGEINFLQKNYDAAEEEFKIVVDKYSKSKRVADAIFKLALVHQNQGHKTQAKQELNRVIKNYPGTAVARLAGQQLDN